MMYWDDHGMSGWGIGLMTLTTLLLLGLLTAAAIVLFRHLAHTGHQPPTEQRNEPEQVLAERLARGEIDPDEYRTRLETLRGTRPDTGRTRRTP